MTDPSQKVTRDELAWPRVVIDQRFIGHDLYCRDDTLKTTRRGPIRSITYAPNPLYVVIKLEWAATQINNNEWVRAAEAHCEIPVRTDGPNDLEVASTGLLLFHVGKITATILPEEDKLDFSLVVDEPSECPDAAHQPA
jgi:hypothetical protein